MSALTGIKRASSAAASPKQFPVAPSVKVYEGAVVGRYPSGANAGCVDNIGADPSLACEGVARHTVDNSANASPGPDVYVDSLIWPMIGTGLDETAEGQPSYGVDNQTFSLASNGGAYPLIGIVSEVIDSTHAYVRVGREAVAVARAQLTEDIVAGAALTDANSTQITRVGRKTWVTLPSIPLTANRSYALPALASCQPGDQAIVTRLDTAAYTAAFTDSGSGTATLFTMPASKVNSATFILNAAGTHWLLLTCGVQ